MQVEPTPPDVIRAEIQEVADHYNRWGFPTLDKEFIEGQFTKGDDTIDQREWQATYQEFSESLQARVTLYSSRDKVHWKEIATTVTSVLFGITAFAGAVGLISGGMGLSASSVAVVAFIALLAIKAGQQASSLRKEKAAYEAKLNKEDKPLLLDLPQKIIFRKEGQEREKLQRAHIYAIHLQYQARGWEHVLDRLDEKEYSDALETLRSSDVPFALPM